MPSPATLDWPALNPETGVDCFAIAHHNDDFGARYYSNRFGRWLSADWSSVPAPVPYADFGNPQSLNLYSYVKNNPLTFSDLEPGRTRGQTGRFLILCRRDGTSGLYRYRKYATPCHTTWERATVHPRI